MDPKQLIIDRIREKIRQIRSTKAFVIKRYGYLDHPDIWYTCFLSAMDQHIDNLKELLQSLA